ncbi:helix-turn-helix transcriptional regulator [Enterococcus sp. BWB1-3]|uniref:helix-turn-helix domain-containing protein n=1 Tax=unclassified Enterococcus TaxID=2608891 RepID=UPI001922B607|nr:MULTISPECIES: helix-turn-helix transcriptional regulator [unclassified Enterococcus]MBL1230335.1 helix-turn-helix transcriptional regulator [Enterococcus sp. BWB1-3]MCB5951047.1 helix-turn-helix transcriptional regulator [Enterococcus sp. BWT-B8]
MNSFGSVIKEIRKKRKLTQKMLSEDICSQSVLSRIENNEELPNVVVMQQICQRLGVTMDQIMQFQSKEVQVVTQMFEKFGNYFRHKEYDKLIQSIKETGLEERIYLDTDWQRYYYYLGSCEFYLYHNYERAVFSLRKGLSYTYQTNKSNLSDLEIQLISCLGSVYGLMGKNDAAEKYLKLSIYYFHELPNERINAELTKIFFNYASFLLQENRPNEAQVLIDQGIVWARKKNSYYYLEELFDLKSKLLTMTGNDKDAEVYSKLTEQIGQIATMKL